MISVNKDERINYAFLKCKKDFPINFQSGVHKG